MEKREAFGPFQLFISPVQLGWGSEFAEACPLACVTEPGSAPSPPGRGEELRRPQKREKRHRKPPEKRNPAAPRGAPGIECQGRIWAGKTVYSAAILAAAAILACASQIRLLITCTREGTLGCARRRSSSCFRVSASMPTETMWSIGRPSRSKCALSGRVHISLLTRSRCSRGDGREDRWRVA